MERLKIKILRMQTDKDTGKWKYWRGTTFSLTVCLLIILSASWFKNMVLQARFLYTLLWWRIPCSSYPFIYHGVQKTILIHPQIILIHLYIPFALTPETLVKGQWLLSFYLNFILLETKQLAITMQFVIFFSIS